MNNTNLSSRVGRLNLEWTNPDQSSKNENEAFQRAMMMAGKEFLEVIFFLKFLTALIRLTLRLKVLLKPKDSSGTFLFVFHSKYSLQLFASKKDILMDEEF